MASIDRRSNGQWRARWREYPGGPQRAQHFDRKIDAQQHLVRQQHDLATGAYVAPTAGRVTVADYANGWLARMRPTWRPSTTRHVETTFATHVLPALGQRPVGSIRRGDVEAFLAGLPLAPSTVAVVRSRLSQVLGAAVDDGLLARNPVRGAKAPRVETSRARPVAPEVMEAVTAALPPWLRVASTLGVGVGLRQGEMSGLTVDRLDLLRRTLRVDRQLVGATLAPPKTSASNRTVPLAGFVVDALAAHLHRHPPGPGGFVVTTPMGKPAASATFGRAWRRATAVAGTPGVRYHDLRHTYASTLLSRGVSVKAVSDWLGHASPTVTLGVYAHLMPADEEVGRRVLDEALAPSAEDSLRTGEGPTTTD